MAIMTILMAVAGPSISALNNSGAVNKISADTARTFEMARQYAMSHQTYVRVLISDIPPGPKVPEGAIVILALQSVEGTLATTNWSALSRPMVLRNFEIRDDLNAVAPNTENDCLPGGTDIAPMSLNVPGLGLTTFDQFIQFRPDGQAGVKATIPARHVKLGLDKRGDQKDRNPVVLRLSGNNGAITVLRKENGIATR